MNTPAVPTVGPSPIPSASCAASHPILTAILKAAILKDRRYRYSHKEIEAQEDGDVAQSHIPREWDR